MTNGADGASRRTDPGYRVVVRRDPEDARFWLADVAGVPGAHTSARSLASLDRYVRETLVLAADLPDHAEQDLALEWEYHTGDPALDEEVTHLRRWRAEWEAAAAELSARTAAAIRTLVSERRFSVREAATLLGVSPARADQLVRAGRGDGRAKERADHRTDHRADHRADRTTDHVDNHADHRTGERGAASAGPRSAPAA